MTDTLTLAHLSDTHLGYEAYSVLSTAGNNLRGEDIVRAFGRNVAEIVAADPPLVLLSGDVGDRPNLPIRYLLFIRARLAELAGRRADGTRRQVVVISGNHDQPRSRLDACFLELFSGIPGVHVVTTHYDVLELGRIEDSPGELADVVVHSLPHDQLKEVDFDVIRPKPGAINILMAHGVAGGSELYLRSIGREYAIPVDVLTRGWDYVALGHYHKQGPVAVGGHSVHTTPIWYAGSTENMGFRDLVHGGGMGRGHLLVDVHAGDVPVVRPINLPIRSMLRLPVIDASGLSPSQITSALVDAVQAAPIAGAVVSQIVTGVPRDIWSLVDRGPALRAAAGAMHYEVSPRHQSDDEARSAVTRERGSLGNLARDLDAIIAERGVGADLIDEVRQLAASLLGSALNQTTHEIAETSAEGTPIEGTASDESPDSGGASAEGGVEVLA